MVTENFWKGFEKKASIPNAAGTIAGTAASGALFKMIRSGLHNPEASGLSKGLGKLVSKAERKHPALGAAATFAIPAAGGALVGGLVRKGTSVLHKRHSALINKHKATIQKHISGIVEKIKKHFGKYRRGKK